MQFSSIIATRNHTRPNYRTIDQKLSIPFYIARRTALAGRSNDGAKASRSPAVAVAIAAVALSVCIMLCAVAIVAGFKQQITDKLTGFNAHLQLFRAIDKADENFDNLITLSPTLRGILADEPYITSFESELTVPALLKTNDDFKGIYVKGTDGTTIRNFLSAQLVEGKMPDFSSPNSIADIAISQKMASDLNLKVGDSIPTFYFNDQIRARRYNVAAIYATHFEQFDDLIALGNLSDLRNIADIKGEQSIALRITTNDFRRANEYAEKLQLRLNEAYLQQELYIPYRVQSIHDNSAAYFSWLSLLDTNVAVILSLMTIVSCITLIAAMLILIIDKVRLIGILRALGATKSQIRRIFIILALRIALRGLIIGNAIGLTLLFLQQNWHLIPLDAEAYYIDFVPVKLQLLPILLLNAAITLVVLLSLLLPSMVAGRISPAESMRYKD